MTPASPHPSCPVPLKPATHITLAHGGGGRLTQGLIDEVFRPAFADNAGEALLHDGVALPAAGARLAFTTDSHVVTPLFFPGGDLGKLAVFGTVNDLAMCGARPRWLSAGFIMEEGLPLETLRRVVDSMREAAAQCAVKIVTGDTKVVERGKADGLYVTTAGIGVIEQGPGFSPANIADGDAIILSGDVGRHGMAIMASREGLAFESTIESDCGSLAGAVMGLLDAGATVHCARDLTRGGLATALVELAEASARGFRIREESIAVTEQVRAACEILGLDPLYVANEGRMVCFVPAAQARLACDAIRRALPECEPVQIGTVHAGPGRVALRSIVGVDRWLDRLSGEQLPRIC